MGHLAESMGLAVRLGGSSDPAACCAVCLIWVNGDVRMPEVGTVCHQYALWHGLCESWASRSPFAAWYPLVTVVRPYPSFEVACVLPS